MDFSIFVVRFIFNSNRKLPSIFQIIYLEKLSEEKMKKSRTSFNYRIFRGFPVSFELITIFSTCLSELCILSNCIGTDFESKTSIISAFYVWRQILYDIRAQDEKIG